MWGAVIAGLIQAGVIAYQAYKSDKAMKAAQTESRSMAQQQRSDILGQQSIQNQQNDAQMQQQNKQFNISTARQKSQFNQTLGFNKQQASLDRQTDAADRSHRSQKMTENALSQAMMALNNNATLRNHTLQLFGG